MSLWFHDDAHVIICNMPFIKLYKYLYFLDQFINSAIWNFIYGMFEFYFMNLFLSLECADYILGLVWVRFNEVWTGLQ